MVYRKARLFFITPPIYFHDRFVEYRKSQNQAPPLRANEQPNKYAAACVATAKSLDISVVDMNAEFANDGRKEELFCDGLHFSVAGAELFYTLILPEIEQRVKDDRGENVLSMNYPYWADINRVNPMDSLKV